MMMSSVDSAMKRSRAYAHLRNCNLCPRECGVNRYETTGMCLIGDTAKVNVIAPHFGEGMFKPLQLPGWEKEAGLEADQLIRTMCSGT